MVVEGLTLKPFHSFFRVCCPEAVVLVDVVLATVIGEVVVDLTSLPVIREVVVDLTSLRVVPGIWGFLGFRFSKTAS